MSAMEIVRFSLLPQKASLQTFFTKPLTIMTYQLLITNQTLEYLEVTTTKKIEKNVTKISQ